MLVIVAGIFDTYDMSEILVDNEPSPSTIEQRSILACYAMRAAWQSTSEGFHSDLSESISYISGHSHFMTGKEITKDDTEAIASSSILAQMTSSSIEKKPLILRPAVSGAVEIFQTTQETFDQLGLSLVIDELDRHIVLETSKAIDGELTSTNRNIEVAARVWRERGTVDIEMESIADIGNAIENLDTSMEVPDVYSEQDGIKIEAYNLADLRNIRSRIDTLPYYKQFFEVEHGKVWLTAILEDLQRIYSEIK